jgi:hypothetical protein
VKKEEMKLNWKTSGQKTIMPIHLPNRKGNKPTEKNDIKRRGRKMSGLIQVRRKEDFPQFDLK